MYPRLSEHSRRVLYVLKQSGVLDGFTIKVRAGLRDNGQLAESLQPLIDYELIGYSGSIFTEDGFMHAY